MRVTRKWRDRPRQEMRLEGQVNCEKDHVRVLYSFPHKIGASRICYTAWQQVNGLVTAGANILLFPGAVSRAVPSVVTVRPTLARGKVRIPYKVVGSMRAFALHDYLVSRRLE
jgi:hypothetical protein